MIELPFVFIAGLLGSSHCIGMCGPLAVAIGSGARSWKRQAARQGLFTFGRVFTYTVMGMAAGYGGWKLTHVAALRNTGAFLAIVAGMVLIYQGWKAAGIGRRRAVPAGSLPCLAGSFLAPLFASDGWMNCFLAGLFTGMIPCGLVYGFLALAAGTGHVLAGGLVMACFGLGTAPAMIATGAGAGLLSLAARRRLLRVAAWSVIIAGSLSVVRGAGFVDLPGWHPHTGCPACRGSDGQDGRVMPGAVPTTSPPQTPTPAD